MQSKDDVVDIDTLPAVRKDRAELGELFDLFHVLQSGAELRPVGRRPFGRHLDLLAVWTRLGEGGGAVDVIKLKKSWDEFRRLKDEFDDQADEDNPKWSHKTYEIDGRFYAILQMVSRGCIWRSLNSDWRLWNFLKESVEFWKSRARIEVVRNFQVDDLIDELNEEKLSKTGDESSLIGCTCLAEKTLRMMNSPANLINSGGV